MPKVKITNLTSESVLIQDLYTTIPGRGSITLERTEAELEKMPSLRSALTNRQVELTVVKAPLVKLPTVVDDVDEDLELLRVSTTLEEHEQSLSHYYIQDEIKDSGMSGDMSISVGDDIEISAAALNAAAAGTFKRTFVAVLKNSTSQAHTWANGSLVLVAAEAVADGDVGAPTVTPASPKWDNGKILVIVTFDTGAGKTYVNGESLTVEVKVAADNKLLGYTVAAATKTFDVVA